MKITLKKEKKPKVKKEVVKKPEVVEEIKTPTHEEVLINKRNPRAGIVG